MRKGPDCMYETRNTEHIRGHLFITQIFRNTNHGGDRKTFEVTTST